VEAVSQADGRVLLERVQPGTYRVIRRVRLQPGGPLVPGTETPVQVTVAAGKTVTLPALKLAVPAR